MSWPQLLKRVFAIDITICPQCGGPFRLVPEEASCRAYIRRLRWPDGFICGRCGFVGEPWVTARGVLICKACNTETSLTAGTVLQDTRKPLRTWFLAMWVITRQKNGVSTLRLQRVLGLGSYETA